MAENQQPGESPAVPKGRSKRARGYLIVVAVLVVFGVVAFGYWYFVLRGVVSTDDAYIDSDPVTISSKILGRITLLTVDEGDTVVSGQLLVQLDDSDLKAQEIQAQANLQYVRANVPLAKVNVERAQDDYDRTEMQYKSGAVTQQQFDHADKTLATTKAQYQIAQDQVKAAEAQLNVIRTQLDNTVMVAPGPGVVARKWVMPGDILQPGQPIFTIYNLQDVWITANYEETKIQSIRLGDKVQITVDAYPDAQFRGEVILIGAAAASQFSLIPPNNASGNFTKVTQRVPVRVALDSVPTVGSGEVPSLLPGMSVVVKIRPEAR